MISVQASIPTIPFLQTLPGGGTVLDADVMATINRDIERRIGKPNTWHGPDRREVP